MSMKHKLPIFILLMLILLGYLLYVPDIAVEELKEKYCDDQSQFMEIQGMQVHYKVEGTGPPLVLIHGTASSLHTWDSWTKHLIGNYKVIRMDIPAFGITGPNSGNDYSINSYVNFIHEFLEILGEDTVSIAGNSLGGRICWNYAKTYPDKISKLILIDPSGLSMPNDPETSIGFKIAKTPILNALFTRVTPKFLHRKSILEVYADPNKVTDELVQRYYELMLRPGNRKAFVERVKVEYKSNPSNLDQISSPTLILWGKQDRWIPYTHAREYQRLIPNTQVIVYENAGHVPMEEIPLKTVTDVISFLHKESVLVDTE